MPITSKANMRYTVQYKPRQRIQKDKLGQAFWDMEQTVQGNQRQTLSGLVRGKKFREILDNHFRAVWKTEVGVF